MNITFDSNSTPDNFKLAAIAARITRITQPRILYTFFSLFLLVLICFGVDVVHAQGVISLNYANFFPGPHKHSVISRQWCNEIERRTGGRVRITYFPGGTLTPAAQTYDNITRGVADIGESCFAYTRGKFPMMHILDLPLGYRSGLQVSRLANAFYDRFRPRELDDVKILYIHGHGPGIVHTRRPVYSLQDLRGMRIRATGMAARVVVALGGVPVGTTMPETYDALRRGIAEGAMAPAEAIQGWKWGEVISSTTQHFGSSYTTGMFVAMNKSRWNSLPPDIQRIFEEVSREWITKKGLLWDEIDREAYLYASRKGHRIITLTQEEDRRWADAVRPYINEYAREVAGKGLPADEALAFCFNYLGHSDSIDTRPQIEDKPKAPDEELPREAAPRETPGKLSLGKVNVEDGRSSLSSGNGNSILEAGETVVLHVRLKGDLNGQEPVKAIITSEARGIKTEGVPRIRKIDRYTLDIAQTVKAMDNFRDRRAVLRIKAFDRNNTVIFDEKITLGTNPSLPLF